MKTLLHKAVDRGQGDYGWLSTRYSFSFADWYNESRVGFGALRVLNDDVIVGGAGFPTHGHRDMEIITIVTEGAVAHKDNAGGNGVVRAGEVQVMSAGKGVLHSEYNASEYNNLFLFQLWILPNKRGITPRYDQKNFDFIKHREGVLPLVNGGEGTLRIEQDAAISYGIIKDKALTVSVGKGNGVYVFVIQSTITIGDTNLSSRDAFGVSDAESFTITGERGATFLLIEVPMLG
jgi:redox-sensitive bicupin YhaK (pirin superfamily)